MSTLFWPGDDRPGTIFSDEGALAAMVEVETAWLDALVAAGIAPPAARRELGVVLGGNADLAMIAAAAVDTGNPVVPLLTLLRARLHDRGDDDAARWVHRGLTSQDVLDTALVLMARDACAVLTLHLRTLVEVLAGLADRHRLTPMAGRTLTQAAVPIRFGAKVAGWLGGVLDAADDLGRLTFPAQVGGAAGTLSGATVLTGGDAAAALDLGRAVATTLGLEARGPWQTHRAPVSRIGEALTRASAAFGRIANDVLVLARPEIGELTEGTGGGSSTMPHKANPVLAVLIRRAALTAPAHLSLLHLAAADNRDERPDGAWHVEWQPLQHLALHTMTSAAQTVALVNGVRVDVDRMADNLAAASGVHSEAESLGEIVGSIPAWAGADDALIDLARDRAATWLAASR